MRNRLSLPAARRASTSPVVRSELSDLPLVSIVVPSWRQGHFLGRTLESLARQTHPALEVLVQDNVSDDETNEVLEEWRDHPRLRIVVEHDQGQSDALLRGFAASRGEILGWLNSDDLLMPHAIEAAVRALRDDDADVAYGHCALVDDAGQFRGYVPGVGAFDARALRNHTPFIPQPGTLFRRSAYLRAGGIDPGLKYTMDWDLWCRLAESGARFSFLPEVLAAARLLPGAKTAQMTLPRLAEITQVNLRHGKPLVPLLYLAHLQAPGLRWLVGSRGFASMRRAWRTRTGRPAELGEWVNGVGPGNAVRGREFAIQFPLFAPVAQACVRIAASSAPRAWSATLNGRLLRPGSDPMARVDILAEDPLVEAIDLRGRFDGDAPPDARVEFAVDLAASPGDWQGRLGASAPGPRCPVSSHPVVGVA